jgi:tetratricopeptide (TPR) repeat protein
LQTVKESLVRLTLTFAAIAVALLGSAAAQELTSQATRREAVAHYRVGQEALLVERWERAAAAFQQAIRLEPLFTDARYGLGTAYMGMQRYVSAIQAFTGCLDAARELHGLRMRDRVAADQQIDDEIRELRETAERMQSQPGRGLRGQQVQQRLQDLDRSRSAVGAPFEPPAGVLLALGSAYFRHGNRELAIQHWANAVRVNTRLGEAWNNLAAVYAATGQRREAEEAVRNAEQAGFRVNPRLKEGIAALGQQ